MTTEAKERAEKLRERAKKLAQNTEDKLRKLKGRRKMNFVDTSKINKTYEEHKE